MLVCLVEYEELLIDVLFEPFKTSKDGGSGIGLLQVKRVVASLGTVFLPIMCRRAAPDLL